MRLDLHDEIIEPKGWLMLQRHRVKSVSTLIREWMITLPCLDPGGAWPKIGIQIDIRRSRTGPPTEPGGAVSELALPVVIR